MFQRSICPGTSDLDVPPDRFLGDFASRPVGEHNGLRRRPSERVNTDRKNLGRRPLKIKRGYAFIDRIFGKAGHVVDAQLLHNSAPR